MKKIVITSLSALALLGNVAPAAAQIRASELGSVSQVIDGTKVTIVYSRPRARDRKEVFGKIVEWGETWTPGANSATTFETNRDLKLNGQTVKQGKYSVWFVVREKGDWTFLLDSTFTRYHMNRPDTNKVMVKFPVHVQDAPFTEVLTWSFPNYNVSGGKLAFQWGSKRVDFDVAVSPSIKTEISRAEAQPYVGRYSFAVTNGNGKRRDFVIRFVNDTLRAAFDKTDVGDNLQGLLVDYMGDFALLRVNKDWFVPALFDEQGKIYEVLRPEMMFEFVRDSSGVKALDIRGAKDNVWASATRKNE